MVSVIIKNSLTVLLFYIICVQNVYANESQVNIAEEKCEEYTKLPSNSYGKLTNNTDAIRGQFPHAATLGYGDLLSKIHWNCEGSLISERFILTVSQCLQSPYGTVRYARLGYADKEGDLANIYFVSQIYKHDEIALIKLSENIGFTAVLKPACLYTKNDIIGHNLIATSWNFTINNIRKGNLQNIKLEVLENRCEQILDSSICVGSAKDIFGGTVGGSLQFYNTTNNLHYLVGLSTKNLQYTNPTYGTYKKISDSINWISNITWITKHEEYKESISFKKCKEYAAATKQKGPPTEVAGGTDAEVNEFSHMAALGYGDISNIQWLCGGSLISHNYVLTAAHCNRSYYGSIAYVQLGLLKIVNGPPSGGVFRLVEKFIVHENYNPPSVYNDIALIKLEKPVDFSVSVKPACLHDETNYHILTRAKPTIEATGWGSKEYGQNKSEILQKVNLNLFDVCNYKISRKLKKGILADTQLCAGDANANKDTCPGDSGGPLQWYYFLDSVYVIVGVTSFGQGCGVSGVPGVYTRVSYFIPWIENIVWSKND